MSDDINKKHSKKMASLKAVVDHGIAAAGIERGLVLLLTGNGKAKSSSAFGMVMRSLGYGYKVGIVQFIKGVQLSGEEMYIRAHHPELPFYQMATGFTWDTQNRQTDIIAAEKTWAFAENLLQDESIHLVVLDELTYMFGLHYLDEEKILTAIKQRPSQQTVVITGRGGGNRLREIADTVAEVQDVKHAFAAGMKARKGVDY